MSTLDGTPIDPFAHVLHLRRNASMRCTLCVLYIPIIHIVCPLYIRPCIVFCLHCCNLNTWHRSLAVPPPRRTADCSVCSIGYSSGIAHSCRKCSGYENSSAAGTTIAVVIGVCLAAAEILRRLGNVAEYEERERLDTPQDFVKRSCTRIQNLILKALPRTAIKIVVVVWQIISQV